MTPQSSTDQTDRRQTLDAPPADGQWFFQSGFALGTVAMFGPPNSEPQFSLRCDTRNQQVIFSLATRLGVATPATMTLITPSRSRTLTVDDASNELPLMQARLPADDALLAALAAVSGQPDRLAVRLNAEPPLVMPADAKIAQALRACGVEPG